MIKKERLETKLEGLLDELKQIGRNRDSFKVSSDNVSQNSDDMRERIRQFPSYNHQVRLQDRDERPGK